MALPHDFYFTRVEGQDDLVEGAFHQHPSRGLKHFVNVLVEVWVPGHEDRLVVLASAFKDRRGVDGTGIPFVLGMDEGSKGR